MTVNLMAAGFQVAPAGLTNIPPSIWTPNPPFRDTVPVMPARRLGVVIHYPGIVAGDYPSIHDVAQAARKQQAAYRARPAPQNYDLGYNSLVDQSGRHAIIRGLYRSAANGTNAANEAYYAIEILVDPDEGLTYFQVLAVQRIIHFLRTSKGYGNVILGHREVKATACPGDQIFAALKANWFEPNPAAWPENVFNPWQGAYGPLPTASKPVLTGGEGPNNYVVGYLQGVLINEASQVITDPDGTYGWSTVSAVVNMKTWYNATKPPTQPPMNPATGTIGPVEWAYIDSLAVA